jgi:hypothetical protein
MASRCSAWLACLCLSTIACGSASHTGDGGGSGAAGATTAGAAGVTGGAGTSGTAGASGAAGASGSAGTSGSAGVSGAAGVLGATGGAGANGGAGVGAAGASGSADAGADAGAELGGASRCAPGKYLLCESFESTAVGAIPKGWTREGDVTLSGVDDKEAARGTHALKLGAADNGARRIDFPATTFGAAHWGRIFYKLQLPVPETNSLVHSTMVALVGGDPQNTSLIEEVRVVDTVQGANSDKHQFLYNVQPYGDAEFGTGSDYVYTFDGAWHCAEWHIDATDQSYHFYFDRNEITQIQKTNGMGNLSGTGIPQAFSTFEVGWNNYQTVHPGFVAWIDEIAVDIKRIGCDN